MVHPSLLQGLIYCQANLGRFNIMFLLASSLINKSY